MCFLFMKCIIIIRLSDPLYFIVLQGVFGDKTEFSTLTRLSYCQCRLKLIFDAICKRFKWEHLAIVYDKTDLFSFTVGK